MFFLVKKQFSLFMDGVFLLLKTLTQMVFQSCLFMSGHVDVLPSWDRSHIPSKGNFADDFPIPMLGHVSSLEGM